MSIHHQLVPHGGWEFQDGSTRFKEQTFDALVKVVIAHRKTNDLPIGDPVGEIEAYIEDKHPYLIINGSTLKKKPMGVSFYQTVQSFVQFLNNWYLKGGTLVDQATADARAKICTQCHNNRPSTETRKKTCCGGNKVQNAIINQARGQIIKNNKTTSENSLLTCLICGCDLKIKVWIPLQGLGQTKEEANAWPSFCWRKKILEDKEI